MSRELVVRLGSKGAFVQIIGIISYAFIANTLDPEELGRYTLFLSTAAILVGFGSMKIGQAILASESIDDALQLTIAAGMLGAIASLIILIFILIGTQVKNLSYFFSLYPAGACWIFPFIVIFGSSIAGLLALFERLTRMDQAANSRLFGSASFLLGILITRFITANTSSTTIAFCYTASLFMQLAIGLLVLLRDEKIMLSSNMLSSNLWIDSLARYKKYIVFGLPTAWVNTLSLESPVLAISYFYGPISAGFYGLSRKLLTSLAPIFNASISKVYYSKAISMSRFSDGGLGKLTSLMVKRSTILLYLFWILAVCLSLVVTFVGSKDWSGSIPFLFLLAIPLAIWTQSQPLTCVYLIKSVPHKQLIWNIQNLIFPLAGFFVVYQLLPGGTLAAVGLMSLVDSYMYYRKITDLSRMVDVDNKTIQAYSNHIFLVYILCGISLAVSLSLAAPNMVVSAS